MLNNIALIPTIKKDVIAAQRTNVGMGHLCEDWNWEKLNTSDKMPMEFYGSRTISWF
jgi:hypothetical protein